MLNLLFVLRPICTSFQLHNKACFAVGANNLFVRTPIYPRMSLNGSFGKHRFAGSCLRFRLRASKSYDTSLLVGVATIAVSLAVEVVAEVHRHRDFRTASRTVAHSCDL